MDRRVRRYRRLYAAFLRLYPKAYQTRFSGSMMQTFTDLLRERAGSGTKLMGYALWMFAETGLGIVREHMRTVGKKRKPLIRAGLISGLVLSVPFAATRLTSEVSWSLFDFAIFGTLLFVTWLGFEWLAGRVERSRHKLMLGLTLAALLFLIWADLAVGIFNIPGVSGS